MKDELTEKIDELHIRYKELINKQDEISDKIKFYKSNCQNLKQKINEIKMQIQEANVSVLFIYIIAFLLVQITEGKINNMPNGTFEYYLLMISERIIIPIPFVNHVYNKIKLYDVKTKLDELEKKYIEFYHNYFCNLKFFEWNELEIKKVLGNIKEVKKQMYEAVKKLEELRKSLNKDVYCELKENLPDRDISVLDDDSKKTLKK